MTDAEEALRLTNKQKFYLKTALDRLAQKYDEQEEMEHAAQVRMLAIRVETHESPRRPLTPQDAMAWQQKFAACGNDVEKFYSKAREWWHEVMCTAPDPTTAFVDIFIPVLNQARGSTGAEILFTIDAKLNDMAEKRLSDDAALNEIIAFIRTGARQIMEGKPLWGDDPTIPGIVQRMQQKLQQQQQQQQQQPPQPPQPPPT